jgi:hypothetical protein
MNNDYFEKARQAHQVGDIHPNGKWVWKEYAPGKFSWRTIKKPKNAAPDNQQVGGNQQPSNQADNNNGNNQQPKAPDNGGNNQVDITKMSHQELVAWAKKTNERVLSEIAGNKKAPQPARQVAYDELKNRGNDVSKIDISDIKKPVNDTDNNASQKQADDNASQNQAGDNKSDDNKTAATPKKTYNFQNKKPKVDITIDKFTVDNKINGTRHDFEYKDKKAQYEKYDDNKILGIVNAHNAAPELRHIAYEIASERKLDESKIDPSGTLQKFWDRKKKIYDMMHENENNVDEDDELNYSSVDTGLGDFDVEGFMKQFPNDDMAWMNADDTRVLEAFGGKSKKLDTIAKRQLYDNFLDDQKRRQPGYIPPAQQLSGLNKMYFAFFQKENHSPLITVSGGAGVGKTYMVKKSLNQYLGYKEYNKKQAEEDPSYDDFDYIFAPQNINSVPKLAKFLNKYPDKILVFDDNDDVLTNPDMLNIMKNLTDGDKDNRKFPEYDEKGRPTGKNKSFNGKMVILTNKSLDYLNRNEDAKAVMSRGDAADIHFTVQENIDALRDRYKTMNCQVQIPNISVKEEEAIRDEIFNFIVENKNKLDPKKFTVRKFINVYKKVYEEKLAEAMSKTSADAAIDFKPKDWRESALEILNKAQETSVLGDDNNLAFYNPSEDWSDELKRKFEKIDKKVKKNNKANDVDEEDDDIDDDDSETAKAMFNEMSINEAEDLLGI